MKTKLVIFVLSIISFCLVVPVASVNAAEPTNLDAPVLSQELPSYANLQREKRSLAATDVASLATPIKAAGDAVTFWGEPEKPGDGTGDNNVGAPVGDVTLPVVLLAILIYFVYRGTSTSKRRNNF